MQLTTHFHLDEFACRDGTPVPCELVENVRLLAENLEVLRAALGGAPIRITSGYRTPDYNRRVGGVKKSQHLIGKAADIVVANVDPPFVYRQAQRLIKAGEMMKGGLGLYRTFVHVDIRGRNARWRGR
jgi:uncharacterized protein YcbK (DUF882 family)